MNNKTIIALAALILTSPVSAAELVNGPSFKVGDQEITPVELLGTVREKRTKGGGIKEIFGCMDNYGYKRTYLYVSGHERTRLRYHQIVAWVFLDEPVEGQWLIRHQDNDKQNNARWNLKFGTALENSYDTYRWRGEVYAR